MSELPVEIEVSGVDMVKVEYLGNIYSFPASLEDAEGDVLDAVDDMKLSHALRGLLSDEDWTAFKATKPKVRDYSELFDAYARTIGLGSTGK